MAWVEKKWTNWTPTVTQTGSVTVTVTHAAYQITGDLCVTNVRLAVTGSGSAGAVIQIGGQPSEMQASANQTVIGMIQILDAGIAHYVGSIYINGATDWRGFQDGAGNFMGAAPNFGLANGDFIFFYCVYRVG